MQQFQVGTLAVVTRHAGSGVFGVEDRIGDQLPDVVVGQTVEDAGAVPAGLDQSGHPELGQMLGHAGRGLPDVLGQVTDGHLPADQRPENLDAGGVGQHAENLDHQVNLVGGQSTAA